MADLFNDDPELPEKKEDPDFDPLTYTVKLLLCQYPLVVIKDRLKEKQVKNGDKIIIQAKAAISASMKADAKHAADFYAQTLRLIIGSAIEVGDFAPALAAMKELRSFMTIQLNPEESKIALNVNFLD